MARAVSSNATRAARATVDGRDRIVNRARRRAGREIAYRCGTDFDALGLGEGGTGTLAERIMRFSPSSPIAARHLAGLVYPPNDLGPTADSAPIPVGVRTLDWSIRTSRRHGTGPRPVQPRSTIRPPPEAVAGVPRDIVRVLGVDVVATPAYRDVALAPGALPARPLLARQRRHPLPVVLLRRAPREPRLRRREPGPHGNTFVDCCPGIVDPQRRRRTGRST